MSIEEWSEKISIVHLSDDPQFTEDLQGLGALIRAHAGIVLDFTGVRYINSSNVSRLLRLRKQMSTTKARLILCGMDTQVWSVFIVTGLDKLFETSENVPMALAMSQME